MTRVLVTCPPMLGMMAEFTPLFAARGIELDCPTVVQTLSENELKIRVPTVDGWIIGDDPATEAVLAAGKFGRLRAAVKWGVGVDNVDFVAAQKLGIPVTNTPQMFGNEVADIAMGYVTGLSRETFRIDREVRQGGWPKPRGISLKGRTVGLIGYGDIGQQTAVRLRAAGLHVVGYDPAVTDAELDGIRFALWPDRIGDCDFLVFTCSLNRGNFHMLNAAVLAQARPGVRIVNVARGPLIDESALIDALRSGHVHSAALDVMEQEPLPVDSPLRGFETCIFGSHNASNTADAVRATTLVAIERLFEFLDRST